ncbi:MAG: site-specific integrase [Rhizobiaceae bacterium]|nr:site-specific integrase [Rhizobiaceae bacterium]
MAKLFYPNENKLQSLGFYDVSTVPVLFDKNGRYCRELNRYLRSRALSEVFSDPDDLYAADYPCGTTLDNIGRQLSIFSDWCLDHRLEWKTLNYKGVLRFQNDMALGRWSPSGRPLEADTANQRADEVTRFLTWAGKVGLRAPLDVKYKVRGRGAAHGGVSDDVMLSRIGRRKTSYSRDIIAITHLPQPKTVAGWLKQVRLKKGYGKYLACRFVLECGTRLAETVAMTEDQIPALHTLDALARAGQLMAPVNLTKTKGSRPRTIQAAIPFLLEIRRWIDGPRMRLRYLYHTRTREAPSDKLFLSTARDHEGIPVSEARLYDCFHKVEPRPEHWTTHHGRHTYACFSILYATERDAKMAGRALSDMGADWINSRGAWHLKTLRKQLGHADDSTTELYLRWLVTASGAASAATGWHNFLAAEMEGN